MGRARWMFLAAAVVLAACSGGAGDGTLVRAEIEGRQHTPPSTTSSTTAGRTEIAAATTAVDPAPAALDPVPRTAPRRPVRRPRAPARATIQPTGHIEIPAIGLSHPTYEGIDLATINHGPSHWPGTPLPGERGNTVFPGHRTTYTRPFWDIDRLRPGDEVIFTTPAGRFTYHVTQAFVVDDSDTWIVDPTDHASFTIFACHPKGSARQRYVVKGDLVSAPAPTTTTTTTPPSTTTTTPPEEERGGIGALLPG